MSESGNSWCPRTRSRYFYKVRSWLSVERAVTEKNLVRRFWNTDAQAKCAQSSRLSQTSTTFTLWCRTSWRRYATREGNWWEECVIGNIWLYIWTLAIMNVWLMSLCLKGYSQTFEFLFRASDYIWLNCFIELSKSICNYIWGWISIYFYKSSIDAK